MNNINNFVTQLKKYHKKGFENFVYFPSNPLTYDNNDFSANLYCNIMTNIENGQHIIIEGCYLPPDHIRDFEPEYVKQIIALYIGFSKNYIDNHFDAGII